jgi:hypothetical protein
MEIIDYYSGFEGEPEVIVTRRSLKGENRSQIRLWVGYYDDIIEQIPPGKNGSWEGIPKDYHLLEGWRDNTDRQCADTQLLLAQLQAIDTTKFRLESSKVHSALVFILRECINTGDNLFIMQD